MTSDSHEQAEDFAVKPEPEDEGWAIRPLMLALIGLAAGYGVHLIIGTDYWRHTPSVMQFTQLTALIVGAGLFGLTVERRHVPAALVFALVCAGVAAGIVWWNGNPDHWGGGDGWRMFSLGMALAIAAPLFQAARDAGGLRFGYASVHDHAWTNIVLWVACWVFVGITWALAWLLASLFQLIEIRFLYELLQKEWFGRCLIGLAFGGGLGLLREHGFVVRLLQRVVTTVLAVLAPVLAAGLVLFLLALPFTGLAPLWKAGSATAILLVCAAGALILANAVIGTAREQERSFPLLRYGAMALGVVILPLAVIAAIAIGLRIDQYGFTPERLWALTFVVIASAFGVAYIVSLVRGRLDWAEKVRPANLVLAFALCGIALVLATPLVSFNAISTRDQVARLESGRLKPEKFDWRALAFDFGEPGKQALKRLAASPNAAIRDKAVVAGKAENKWDVPEEPTPAFTGKFDIKPAGAALPEALRAQIVAPLNDACGEDHLCRVYLQADGRTAVVLRDRCPQLQPEQYAAPNKGDCGIRLSTWGLEDGKWQRVDSFVEDSQPVMTPEQERASLRREHEAIVGGDVTIRPVTRRQVFVGDKPHGQPFE
jgi:hypothetical protein